MKTRILRATGAMVLLVITTGTLASERLDHDEVKRLRETGQILSMDEVMASAQSVQPGQMVEAELEREAGAYRYEIKILASDGRIHVLDLDAATGEVIEHRER